MSARRAEPVPTSVPVPSARARNDAPAYAGVGGRRRQASVRWIMPDVFLAGDRLDSYDGVPPGGVAALLPTHGVYAIDCTQPTERAGRRRGRLLGALCRAFRRLWPKIPLRSRRRILKAWNPAYAVLDGYYAPQIAICEPRGWSDGTLDGSAGFWWRHRASGRMGNSVLLPPDIVRLSLQAPRIRGLPANALLEFVLAHELAHLTQDWHAARKNSRPAGRSRSARAALAELLRATEMEAHRLAAAWTGLPVSKVFAIRDRGLRHSPAERRRMRDMLEAAVQQSRNGDEVLADVIARGEDVDIREILDRLRFRPAGAGSGRCGTR